jgi:hypothetical protein
MSKKSFYKETKNQTLKSPSKNVLKRSYGEENHLSVQKKFSKCQLSFKKSKNIENVYENVQKNI